MVQEVVINGCTSNMAPDNALVINRAARFEPPIINGYMPTDISINGLARPPVLNGCVLNLPLWHPILRPSSFKSLDAIQQDCTIAGALWTPQGRSYDGADDLLTVTDSASIQGIDTAITGEMWLKANTGYGEINPHLIHRVDVKPLTMRLIVTTGRIETYASIDGTVRGLISDEPYVVPVGRWTYIAFTFDGTTRVIYINGVAVKSNGDHAGALDTGTGDYYIGDNGNHDRVFDGTIAETRIYNCSLTAAEIKRNYLAGRWRYQ